MCAATRPSRPPSSRSSRRRPTRRPRRAPPIPPRPPAHSRDSSCRRSRWEARCPACSTSRRPTRPRSTRTCRTPTSRPRSRRARWCAGAPIRWSRTDVRSSRCTSSTRDPIITGDALTDAQPTMEPIEGTVVTFTLSNEGGRKFKTETGKHVKDYMAIVLDDRVMSAAGHPERDRHARPDHDGRQGSPGRAGSRAGAARRRAAGAAQGRRSARDRRKPRPGLRDQGHQRRRDRGRARRAHHARCTTASPACWRWAD